MSKINVKPKIRILVVEDDEENQKYLELILRRNYNLDFCDSPNEWKKLLPKNNYDIFIIDITLKGEKSGLSLIKELKESEKYKNVPIIGLSAHVFSQDRKEALSAGVDVYLTKPIDNKKLTDTIAELIGGK